MTDAIVMKESSPISELWTAFTAQMKRMDELESRIEARAVQTRRRISNLLEKTGPTRQSHLRLWISHQYAKADYLQGIPEHFKLQLEGVLLIGHLDHKSASQFDQETGYGGIPKDDLDRSKGGEKEEDQPIPAYLFTHFMESLVVELQTVFRPKNPVAAAVQQPKKKKSSRRSTGGDTTPKSMDPSQVDLRTCYLSEKQEMRWTRDMSDDSHAWCVKYRPPTPPDTDLEIHSVVAQIQMHPSMHADIVSTEGNNMNDRYTIRHPLLVKHMFPHHGTPEEDVDEEAMDKDGAASGTDSVPVTPKQQKRKGEDRTADGNPLPPLDNELHFPPPTLTMSQIIMAFYVYINDKNLMDPDNKSVVVADSVLQEVLGLERFSFSQLQTTLLQKQVIVKVTKPYPLKITYIMPKKTGDGEEMLPWQFDMECTVPSLLGYRLRELLRRIKRRELEYTSSRTKARYLLAARRGLRSNAVEDNELRQMIEAAVTSDNLAVPEVWQALARGAPPNSEARRAARIEAQLSYLLLEMLPAQCRNALTSRQLVNEFENLADDAMEE
ncbi:hypothetical protein FisN_15Hh075 [Fistulifera solaris]|uniref:DM2 domain-containing protein n=1 Tax=Fistulifera solaris TaxID=1519565 RepID=A0A1Z5KA02_FISSO|nr:hypothetical protein FisN_15Hh075 [Fistulifera solaris]|eukprot:GAX23026.1 hypothetical protein FisN_15Hh075 [Fistulifera solaris]